MSIFIFYCSIVSLFSKWAGMYPAFHRIYVSLRTIVGIAGVLSLVIHFSSWPTSLNNRRDFVFPSQRNLTLRSLFVFTVFPALTTLDPSSLTEETTELPLTTLKHDVKHFEILILKAKLSLSICFVRLFHIGQYFFIGTVGVFLNDLPTHTAWKTLERLLIRAS